MCSNLHGWAKISNHLEHTVSVSGLNVEILSVTKIINSMIQIILNTYVLRILSLLEIKWYFTTKEAIMLSKLNFLFVT